MTVDMIHAMLIFELIKTAEPLRRMDGMTVSTILHVRSLLCAAVFVTAIMRPAPGSAESDRSTGSAADGREIHSFGADRPDTNIQKDVLYQAAPWDQSSEGGYYFYRGLRYGSEALVNPLRLILSGGYGILQIESRDNRLNTINYRTGFDNVWLNLRDPFLAIREEGFSDFILTQVLPFSVSSKKAYYWPNYTLHLIGGGMSYRMMEEWFRYHDYPHPKVGALATLFIYHLLNEVVENSDFEGYNTDPIADMYIFNPLGIWLFSSERVSQFFSSTLNMADWSYQVSYDPWRNAVENIGQNFAMKYWFGESRRYGLFYHFGNHGELGASFARGNGDCISIGAGLLASKLINLSERTDLRSLTAEMVPSAGVFYDRNNSLLASLMYARRQDYMLRLNIYPGLFRIRDFSPGLFLSMDQDYDLSAGITVSFLPIGLARKF
jgi:hypothetical protein